MSEWPETVCRNCQQSKLNCLFTPSMLAEVGPLCRKCQSDLSGSKFGAKRGRPQLHPVQRSYSRAPLALNFRGVVQQ